MLEFVRKTARGTARAVVSARSDIAGIAGLGLLSTGLWWIYPPLTLLALGAALFAAGVRWAIRDSRTKQ